MTTLFLLPCLLMTQDPSQSVTLRYLRPAGEKWVLESEITSQRMKEGGHRYVSRTERPGETLTLSVHRDGKGGLIKAEVVVEQKGMKQSAVVTPNEGKLRLTRGEKREDLDAGALFFTSAPDWSDIIELANLYDMKKGGKQEFAGLWIHPTRPTLTPNFSIEKVDVATIRAKDVEYPLRRFKVRLRASTNTVWVLPNNRVCKILPDGAKAAPIVLEGFEIATKDLK